MKKLLTAKFVQSVAATAARQEITDTASPNLMLIVQPTGSKSWRWRGAVNGSMKKLTLGKFPLYDLAAARAWADKLTIDRDAGIDITQASKPAPETAENEPEVAAEEVDHRTCDWMFEQYMEGEGSRRKSAPEKRRMYERDIKPIIGAIPAAKIVHDDIARILRHKAKTAPVQSNALQALIRRWFRWSVTVGRDLTGLTEDPTTYVVKLSPPTDRKRFLNDYEISIFYEAIGNTDYVMNEVLIFILLNGVRRAEAFEAPWSEFDLHKKLWTIPGERTKNALDHVLPLSGASLALLEARKAKSGTGKLVWPSGNAKVSDSPMSGFSLAVAALHKEMVRLAKLDGKTIDKWTIHDLRRTLSSGMNGLHDANEQPLIAAHIVERVINHKLGGVAGIYNKHEYQAEKRQALALWADHLGALKRAAEARSPR